MSAKLLPWNGRIAESRDAPPADAAADAPVSAFEPIPDTVILIPDEHLDAFGTIFCSSPLRRSMTFEAYLFVKGYGSRVR